MSEHEHVCTCGASITCDEPDCRLPLDARCGSCVAKRARRQPSTYEIMSLSESAYQRECAALRFP